ncbi:MAG: MFS transporter [Anaerolineae bacterium]
MLEAQVERVPRTTKLIYALGEFGPSVGVGTVIPFYFLFFLTDVAHLRAGLAGTILLVARLWDAINDPLVGLLSDRTRSRWGRRKPYMVAGTVPMGITFALLWVVPPLADATALVLYYLVVYLLFDLFYTLVTGPYVALTPEMTLDADERTSVVTYRMVVSIVTGLAAAVAMPFVFNAAPSMQAGFAILGVSIGFISALPYLAIARVVDERPEFQQDAAFGLLQSLRSVLRNRAFWISLGIYLLGWMAIALVEAVFAYYVVYWVGMPEEDSPILLALILGSATLFLPVVNGLSHRLEKKWAYVVSTAVWALAHLTLWFIPQMMILPVAVVAAVAGLGVASAHVLPMAMGVDVLESVELDSGQRQEGVFGGLSAFVHKLATSLALFALGWALEWAGYVGDAPSQTPQALLAIRTLVSLVPCLLLVGSLFLAARFPITRERHWEMRAELAARRASRLQGLG